MTEENNNTPLHNKEKFHKINIIPQLVGAFYFFIIWYIIHYDSSLKSPLLIELGFMVYFLSIWIVYLYSIIRQKTQQNISVNHKYSILQKEMEEIKITKLLSKEQRSEIAKRGALKRWQKVREEKEKLKEERTNNRKISGSLGGKKSSSNLTPQQRKERSKKALTARWGKYRKQKQQKREKL